MRYVIDCEWTKRELDLLNRILLLGVGHMPARARSRAAVLAGRVAKSVVTSTRSKAALKLDQIVTAAAVVEQPQPRVTQTPEDKKRAIRQALDGLLSWAEAGAETECVPIRSDDVIVGFRGTYQQLHTDLQAAVPTLIEYIGRPKSISRLLNRTDGWTRASVMRPNRGARIYRWIATHRTDAHAPAPSTASSTRTTPASETHPAETSATESR